jgi:hypothetical protein
MRVILVVDVVFLGSLLVAGFSLLFKDKKAKAWTLRICAFLGGVAAVLWLADATGAIRLPRPHDAPPPITNLPDKPKTVPSAGSAPVIINKVKHQNIKEDRDKQLNELRDGVTQ